MFDSKYIDLLLLLWKIHTSTATESKSPETGFMERESRFPEDCILFRGFMWEHFSLLLWSGPVYSPKKLSVEI